MMASYRHAPTLGRPAPPHTLMPGAASARASVATYAEQRNAARDAPPAIVTRHPLPWVREDLDDLTGPAATFAKAALAAGREVAARRAGLAVQVAVRQPRIRVLWYDGKLGGSVTLGTGAIVEGRRATLAQAKAALS